MSTTATEPPEPQTETVPDTTAEEEDPEIVTVDHRGSRLSRVLCLVSVLTGVVLVAPFAILALPFAVSGLVIAAGGLFVADSRGWLSAGVGLVLAGQLVAGGFTGVPVEFMLIGVSATVLGWDVGLFGIDVGQQLGRQTVTQRLEVTHTVFTLSALAIANVFVYGIYRLSGAGRPASAVALSVIGAILFVWVYRR